MRPQALDALQSQEDRAALAESVGRELAPPREMARVYGRLVFESRQAQLRAGKGSDTQERLIAQAMADQVEWLGGEFRQIFLEACARMFQWCHRLHLTHPTPEWSPEAWVKAARDLGAESELLCRVITNADALAWDAWIQAFSKDQDWPAQWFGWENAFASVPRLASRWLEVLLDSQEGRDDPDRVSRLSFSRGRIWQKIHSNQKAGRPVEVLTRLDGILEKAGAPRALSSVDFTIFLKRDGKITSPMAAKEALEAFLSASPEDARQWLSCLHHPPQVPVRLSSDRPDLRGLAVLSWLASQGECTANQVREVFDQWATLLDDADWMLVMDKAFLAALGIEVAPEEMQEGAGAASPSQQDQAKAQRAKAKKEKAAKKKEGVQPPKVEDLLSVASSSPSSPDTQVPLEAIPRFAPRK